LVDTSVWVDHFRQSDATLVRLLEEERVLMHPFALGELALGRLRQRRMILATLAELPHAVLATCGEVASFIENKSLFGRGVGYVDAHLLASVLLGAGSKLWTRDRRLRQVAGELGLAM